MGHMLEWFFSNKNRWYLLASALALSEVRESKSQEKGKG
jgi:hypothetical protein